MSNNNEQHVGGNDVKNDETTLFLVIGGVSLAIICLVLFNVLMRK